MSQKTSRRSAVPAWFWIVLAAVLYSLAGCNPVDPVASDASRTSAESETAQGEAASRGVPVRTVAVQTTDVPRTTTQPATVHAYYEAQIRSRAAGYVKTLNVDVGDVVAQGDVLLELDIPELEKREEMLNARLQRLEAEERRDQAGVDLAKANVNSAQALLEQSRSELVHAEAVLAASEAEYRRIADLVERQSLERRLLDEATKKRDSDRASKSAAESAIVSAQADVAVAEASLAAAQADLSIAQAETAVARKELEELQVRIGFATLTAPFPGVITMRAVDPGDLVREMSDGGAERQAPLFVLSQLDPVRIHVQVPEAQAAFVNRGDTLTLTLPSFPGESRTASVTRTAQSLDPSTRTMLVEAELANPDGKLLPGMFGQATIEMETKVAALMLPARAVRFDESGEAFVYVVDEQETVSVVDVTTGYDDGHRIEIRAGLESDQTVIDSHLQRFTDGQKVSRIP